MLNVCLMKPFLKGLKKVKKFFKFVGLLALQLGKFRSVITNYFHVHVANSI